MDTVSETQGPDLASPKPVPAGTQGQGASHPAISVARLWKVFGAGQHDRALQMAAAGAARREILAATGHTIGVRDVSFSVAPGETFVVMGLSGSGKSTLIRCLSRLIEPSSGDVHIGGDDLLAMDADALRAVRRTKMSMVFQHFGLFPHRRVIDNVAYGLEVQGIAKGERRRRAHEVLGTVGLTEWAEHYPQQLSGGMQQRVGLARALALDPEILFFDEPFSALDPLIRREMQDELLRLRVSMRDRSAGSASATAPSLNTMHRTILFITHDFDEALRLGDRIAIMKDGAIDQIGTPEDIVLHPATDYVRRFTNDVPKSKVLTARSVTTAGMVPSDSPRVAATVAIETILAQLLSDDRVIGVVDEAGGVLGVVDRLLVAKVLAGERP